MCPSPGPLPREDKNVQLQYYLGKGGGAEKSLKMNNISPLSKAVGT